MSESLTDIAIAGCADLLLGMADAFDKKPEHEFTGAQVADVLRRSSEALPEQLRKATEDAA